MIHRFVKMTFKPEEVKQFLVVFEQSKNAIADFPGCMGLKLIQDTASENILYTFSLWAAPSALEAYRNSELFKSTWAKTKVLFADKPLAWSTLVIDQVK
jgi:quinol monooxygenase YgiN